MINDEAVFMPNPTASIPSVMPFGRTTVASAGCEIALSMSGTNHLNPEEGHGNSSDAVRSNLGGQPPAAEEALISLPLSTLRSVASMPDKKSALSNLLFISQDDRLAGYGLVQIGPW